MGKQNKQEQVKVSKKPAQSLKNLDEARIDKSKEEEKDSSLRALDSRDDKTQQIEALTEKLKQSEADNLYLRAEFENFKRRSLEERYMALRYEGEKFISSLATEVLDDLERALFASKENKSLEDLQKGLEIIHKKINKLLSRFGVAVLDPTGKAFDPSYQEALNFIKNSKVPEDYVVETYKKAYKMHDKVIRPAQVIVAKKEE